MDKSEAFSAQKLLALLAEHGCSCSIALITERIHCDFRNSVVSPVSIEVAFPKARNAEVILAIITTEGSGAIFTFFTLLLRLDDLPI
jgi:hypothetical protein